MNAGGLKVEARQMEEARKNLQFDLSHVAGELETWRNHSERGQRDDVKHHIEELERAQMVLVEAAYRTDRDNLLRAAREGFKQKGIKPPKGIKLNREQKELFLRVMAKDR